MRTGPLLLACMFLFGALVGLPMPSEQGGVSLRSPLVDTVAAQDDNVTMPEAPDDPLRAPYRSSIQIQVTTERAFATLGENQVVSFPVKIRDRSVQGTEYASSGIPVSCVVVNQTQGVSGWGFTPPVQVVVPRHGEADMTVMVSTGIRPRPEFFELHFTCTAGGSVNQAVGNFSLRAKAEEFVYMTLAPNGVVPPVGPDEEATFSLKLTNGGSHPKRFLGRIDHPDGWVFPAAPTVVLGPGESTIVNVTGVSPRDQLLYLSQSQAVRISYHPDGAPGKEQLVFQPVTLSGVYLHPALIPFTVLALTLLAIFIWMAVLAKRQVEEQILGKPVPPWRIPEEIEMLERLEREDPDEHYVVRYYLMPEEYQSALLWYHAYKQATKQDRKRETKWFKVKRKQEGKVHRLEARHERLAAKYDRKIKVVEFFRGLKKKKLERKNACWIRKGQRTVDKRRRKKVKRIEKRHAKLVAKTTKRHDRLVAKETKRVEKENRRRAKRDEEPLPLPEMPPPEIEDPEMPPEERVEEVPVSEGHYAKRYARVMARYDRKVARRERRKARALEKDQARLERKRAKLMAKVPPEPKTHLYDQDEYLAEDEIVVETDRSRLATMLRIPTLEERERARRQRELFAARRKALQAAGDEEGLQRLAAEYAEAKQTARGGRREEAASRREARLVAKEEQRRLKRRARELAREAKEEASLAHRERSASTETAREALTPSPSTDASASADGTPPEGGPTDGSALKRLRVGFRGRAAAPERPARPAAEGDADASPDAEHDEAGTGPGLVTRLRRRRAKGGGDDAGEGDGDAAGAEAPNAEAKRAAEDGATPPETPRDAEPRDE